MKYLKIITFFFLVIYGYGFGQTYTINETKSNKNSQPVIYYNQSDNLTIKEVLDKLKLESIAFQTEIDLLNAVINDTIISNNEISEKKVLLSTKLKLKRKIDIVIGIYEHQEEPDLKEISIRIYESRIKEFEDKIKAIKLRLQNTDSEIDYREAKLSISIINNEIDYFNENYLNLLQNKIRPSRWLPTCKPFFRTSFFETYYNQTLNKTSYLNSLSYLNSDSSSLLSTELVSDRLGWFRVSFGSAISFDDDKENSITKKKIEKLINLGGNFYLDLTLPLVSTYNSKYLTYYSFTNARIATNIKGFDSDIDNTNFNASFGIKNYFSIASDKKEFLLSFLIDSNLHFASNDVYQSLNIKKKILFNTNFVAYLTISEKYRIALRTNLASQPSIRTNRVAFGLQLLK